MPQSRSRRVASSFGRRLPGPTSGFSAEDLQLIPQLLQLFRSGALTALLPPVQATGAPSKGSISKQPQATNVAIILQESPAADWKTVKSRAKPSTTDMTEQSKETLESEGWSVPVRSSISELRLGASGVCLATCAETKQVRKELKADQPTAVLSPINVDGEGTEISVFTTDKHGRAQTRVRYMFQLGPTPVVFRSSAPLVKSRSDSSKVVLTLHREQMESPKWDYALKHGRSAIRLWIKERAKVDAMDIRPPTRPCGDTDSMQVVAFVPTSSVAAILKCSSMDGVFTREYYESDADRDRYKIVPLPLNSTIESAQRQATWLSDMSMGIVNTRRGFAIRVVAAQYDHAVKMIYPNDSEKLLGKRWEISGLPLSMGGPALIEFLDGWRVSPEYTFRQGSRRTWIVRAATEPHITKVQHDQGLAVVKEAKPRPAATSPTIEKFVAKADPQSVASSSKKAMPQSWASIVRNGPPAASATQAAPRAAPSPQAPQPVHSKIGLEKILASAIAAALQPFQEQFEKMQCAIVQLQEETQCGYSDMEFSDLEDAEEKSDSPAAPAASAPKKPRISKAGKVRSKVAK